MTTTTSGLLVICWTDLSDPNGIPTCREFDRSNNPTTLSGDLNSTAIGILNSVSALPNNLWLIGYIENVNQYPNYVRYAGSQSWGNPVKASQSNSPGDSCFVVGLPDNRVLTVYTIGSTQKQFFYRIFSSSDVPEKGTDTILSTLLLTDFTLVGA